MKKIESKLFLAQKNKCPQTQCKTLKPCATVANDCTVYCTHTHTIIDKAVNLNEKLPLNKVNEYNTNFKQIYTQNGNSTYIFYSHGLLTSFQQNIFILLFCLGYMPYVGADVLFSVLV